nr:MAG TPA: hypothetical protein [Bacteriophage sp.]
MLLDFTMVLIGNHFLKYIYKQLHQKIKEVFGLILPKIKNI